MRLHREGTPTIIIVTLFCTGLMLATALKAPGWLLIPVALLSYHFGPGQAAHA